MKKWRQFEFDIAGVEEQAEEEQAEEEVQNACNVYGSWQVLCMVQEEKRCSSLTPWPI